MEQRIKLLFRKYLSNSCTSEELEEFFQCIRMSDQDESLRQILQETYESILNASDTYVNQAGDLIIPGSRKPFIATAKPVKRLKRRVLTAMTITGLVITVFAAGIFVKARHKPPKITPLLALMKKTSTERAEYKYILLPDSTQVWLNAGSSLEYPENFDKPVREVTLSGEAYFDVKHAAEHPFIIHTGEILTTVMGTAFNINAYADRKNIKVSVSRGKVKVSRGRLLLATLVKDQEIKVSKMEDQSLQKVLSTNTVAAWQQGNLVYEDETLSEIIADLERVYDVHIQVAVNRMNSVLVTTRFRRELGIGQALEILCKLTDSHLEQKNGTFIIQ
jgi:transmembrane sensor